MLTTIKFYAWLLLCFLSTFFHSQVSASGLRPIDEPFDPAKHIFTAINRTECNRIKTLPIEKIPGIVELLLANLKKTESGRQVNTPRVILDLQELACAYERSGQELKAQNVFEKILSISEQLYGPDHLQTATALSRLGISYIRQNREKEALPFSERALKITERRFGDDYVLLVGRMINSALLYCQLGRFSEALVLGQRTLALAQTHFGQQDKIMTTVLFQIGWIHFKIFDYDQAHHLFERVLKIRQEQLPAAGNDVDLNQAIEFANTLRSLGALYFAKEKYADASAYYERALSIYKKSSYKLDTALITNNLVLSLFMQHGKPDYIKTIRNAIAMQDSPPGPDRILLTVSFANMGFISLQNGDFFVAQPIYQKALEMIEAAGGHPLQLASVLIALSELYLALEVTDKAEQFGLRALAIREEALGPRHPATAITLNRLALVRQKQGKYQEAEALNQRALTIYENTFGIESFKLVGLLRSMASLYTDMKQPKLAQAVTNRLLVIEKTEVKK